MGEERRGKGDPRREEKRGEEKERVGKIYNDQGSIFVTV